MAYHSYQPSTTSLVTTIEGRFDADLAAQVTATWAADGRVRHIIVDLSDVTLLDSSGLAALVNGQGIAREREGELIIASPSEAAGTILALTGLDRTFEIVPSIADALARIGL